MTPGYFQTLTHVQAMAAMPAALWWQPSLGVTHRQQLLPLVRQQAYLHVHLVGWMEGERHGHPHHASQMHQLYAQMAGGQEKGRPEDVCLWAGLLPEQALLIPEEG